MKVSVPAGTAFVFDARGVEYPIDGRGQVDVDPRYVAGLVCRLGSPPKVLPANGRRRNAVCVFGDSRAANCNYLASNLAYALDTSWLHWAQALAGVDIELLGNDGVGGETSSQILARVGNVIAKRPGVAFLIGGFNDFSASLSLASVISNMTEIITRLNNAGIYVVYLSNTGYDGVNGSIISGITPQDRWAQDFFANRPEVGRYVDAMSATTNTATGAFLAGASTDGIHLSNYGAYLVGARLAGIMAELFPAVVLPSSPFDSVVASPLSAQLLGNPLFNGVGGSLGGGITGSVADSWTAARTGGLTAVMSLVAGDESAVAQQASITATANNERFTLTSETVTARTALGDLLTGAARIKVTGATNLKRLNLWVQNYGSPDHHAVWGQDSGNATYNLPGAFTVKPQTPRVQRNGAGTCRLVLAATFSGAGGAVIAVERASLSRVTGNA